MFPQFIENFFSFLVVLQFYSFIKFLIWWPFKIHSLMVIHLELFLGLKIYYLWIVTILFLPFQFSKIVFFNWIVVDTEYYIGFICTAEWFDHRIVDILSHCWFQWEIISSFTYKTYICYRFVFRINPMWSWCYRFYH